MPVPEIDADESSTQLNQAFYDSVAKAVGERLEECGPRIPVVTGTSQSNTILVFFGF